MMTYNMKLEFISDEMHGTMTIRNFKLINEDTAFVFAQSPVIGELKNNSNPVSYNYLMYSDNFGIVRAKCPIFLVRFKLLNVQISTGKN